MPTSRSLNDTLSAAINDMAEHGFDSEGRITFWTNEIRKAAEREMKSEADMDNALRRALHSIYSRLIEKGDIAKYHVGVSRFTLQKVKPALRAELDRRIMASAQLIKSHRRQAIDQTLQRFQGWSTSIPAGGSKTSEKAESKVRIKKSLASLPFEERRVLIDQGHKLNASLSEVLAKGGQALAGEWHSHWRQAGYDYREDHKERDKQVYLLRDTWAQQKGLIKPGLAGYYDSVTSVGEEPFCFPGDSEIPFADGVVKGYRRFYSGELVELETSSGSKVRATPNHPVLTSSGWRAIGLLDVGDDVIEVAHENRQLAKENNDQRVPMISEIFSTLQEDGIVQTVNQHPAQFHGDGSKGYVDIVLAARSLLIDFITKRPKPIRHLLLASPEVSASGVSTFDHCRSFLLRASDSVMGFLSQQLSPSFADALHAKGVSLRNSPFFDVHFFQSNRDRSSSYPQSLRNRQNAFPFLERTSDLLRGHVNEFLPNTRSEIEPVFLKSFAETADVPVKEQSDLPDGFPFATQTTNATKVKRTMWSGHVFNLQTAEGYYVTQNIIVHNCRCYMKWIYNISSLPKNMLTKKGAEELANAKRAA